MLLIDKHMHILLIYMYLCNGYAKTMHIFDYCFYFIFIFILFLFLFLMKMGVFLA